MAHVVIHAEKCKACMLCVEFCPRHCLAMSKSINTRGHHPAEVQQADQCTGCRICALMCPDVCIDVYREKKSAVPPSQETA